VLATVAIVIIGQSLAALGIVLALRHSFGTALTVSAALAQIGECSFILAGRGMGRSASFRRRPTAWSSPRRSCRSP
jgi:predicted Kef-type K+ transport protein